MMTHLVIYGLACWAHEEQVAESGRPLRGPGARSERAAEVLLRGVRLAARPGRREPTGVQHGASEGAWRGRHRRRDPQSAAGFRACGPLRWTRRRLGAALARCAPRPAP